MSYQARGTVIRGRVINKHTYIFIKTTTKKYVAVLANCNTEVCRADSYQDLKKKFEGLEFTPMGKIKVERKQRHRVSKAKA